MHDDIIRSQFKKRKIPNQRKKTNNPKQKGRKRVGLYKNEESL